MNTPQKHRRKLLLGDGLLIGCILLVCIALAIVPHLSKKATSAFVKVSVDGKSYAVYPLEVDTTVEIGQTGVRFVIENGKAFIAASDCPDQALYACRCALGSRYRQKPDMLAKPRGGDADSRE